MSGCRWEPLLGYIFQKNKNYHSSKTVQLICSRWSIEKFYNICKRNERRIENFNIMKQVPVLNLKKI